LQQRSGASCRPARCREGAISETSKLKHRLATTGDLPALRGLMELAISELLKP
jgi:hypothetical protein